MLPYYTTVYRTDGSKILYEQRTNDQYGSGTTWTIYYIYDTAGSVIGFEHNGTKYWYDKNLQGDITAIRNASGTLVAQYEYDAWGKHIRITDGSGNDVSDNPNHIANINPFRYRGYYFDVETGWYYLNARYYDPNVGRFISPDAAEVLTASPLSLTDKNLYAYCDNNPVVRIDSDGKFWDTLFDVVSLVVSVVDVITNPTDPMAWAGLAADTLSLVVPGLTGGGSVVRAMTKADDVVDAVKTIDNVDNVVDAAKTIYKAANNTSDIRKATGSYEILYKSGKTYVGKGGFKRAIHSAERVALENSDIVASISWKRATNSRAAFIDEYTSMSKLGGPNNRVINNKNSYNKIWSPGRNYYYEYHGSYYWYGGRLW